MPLIKGIVHSLRAQTSKMRQGKNHTHSRDLFKQEVKKGFYVLKEISNILIELNNIQNKDEATLLRLVKISPVGRVVGGDGREFNIDADKVLKAAQKSGVDIVLDCNHKDGEAMGWFNINSLEVKEDGIYAALELTPAGKSLVKDKSFRYLSPAYRVQKGKGTALNVVSIEAVGLVNRPNLLNEALNNKGETMPQIDEELNSLKAKNEELIKQNSELLAKIELLNKNIADLELNAKRQKIESAIKAGEMIPARKDEALSFNGAALDSFMAVCKSEAEHVLNKSNIKPEKDNEEKLNPDVARQLGLA